MGGRGSSSATSARAADQFEQFKLYERGRGVSRGNLTEEDLIQMLSEVGVTVEDPGGYFDKDSLDILYSSRASVIENMGGAPDIVVETTYRDTRATILGRNGRIVLGRRYFIEAPSFDTQTRTSMAAFRNAALDTIDNRILDDIVTSAARGVTNSTNYNNSRVLSTAQRFLQSNGASRPIVYMALFGKGTPEYNSYSTDQRRLLGAIADEFRSRVRNR